MAKVDAKPTRWQDLTGEARWELIEQVRRGDVPVTALCASLGISRQTLYRAMAAAAAAAKQALTPKPAGRQKKPVSQRQVETLQRDLAEREQELSRWRQKYEVTRTLLTLERQLAQGKPLPGEERKKRRRRK
jgi:hypothetical protein